MDINCILLDLEIIKQIKENEKLAIHILPGSSKLFVDNNVFFSGIKRWYNGYNREDSIKYLEDLVTTIDRTSDLLISGSHIELAENLKNAVKSSICGLENLKNTYNSDSISIAKIILIINKLNKIIESLDNIDTLPNYKEMSNISLSMIQNVEENFESENKTLGKSSNKNDLCDYNTNNTNNNTNNNNNSNDSSENRDIDRGNKNKKNKY